MVVVRQVVLVVDVQRGRNGLGALVVVDSKTVRALIQIRIAVGLRLRRELHEVAQGDIEHVLLAVRPVVSQTDVHRIHLETCRLAHFAILDCARTEIVRL